MIFKSPFPNLNVFDILLEKKDIVNNGNIRSDYNNFFSNLDLYKFEEQNSQSLSQIFYDLGLIAYNNNEDDLVAPLWYTSEHLFPELSYPWVELASFYYYNQEKEKALETLKECVNHPAAYNHCNFYIDKVDYLEKPEYYRNLIDNFQQ